MKKLTVPIKLEPKKLEALQYYLAKKDIDLQSELQDCAQKLYEKHVPKETRSYIEEQLLAKEKPKVAVPEVSSLEVEDEHY